MQQFLTFSKKVQELNLSLNLSSYEISILDFIARSSLSNEAIFVGNVLHKIEIASQATLHSHLKKLVEKNLIVLRTDKKDGRNKSIVLAKSAIRYFNKIESLMSSSSLKK